MSPGLHKKYRIEPEEVLGHNISQLTGRNKLYTGGAVADVIKTGKAPSPINNLQDVTAPNRLRCRYTYFDDQGNLRQVVAISRTIVSLKH